MDVDSADKLAIRRIPIHYSPGVIGILQTWVVQLY
jgi:hypothetical protein